MDLTVKQVSSLEKVRSTDALNHVEIHNKTVMQGERFSYQICVRCDERLQLLTEVESPLTGCISLYHMREVPMDAPVTEEFDTPEDYITLNPGLMPDLLIPMEETDYQLSIGQKAKTIWVKVDIPKDMEPGTYAIKIKMTINQNGGKYVGTFYQNMRIEVIPAVMPAQKLIYTRWFYADCFAVAHAVEIYSEKHWDLIDKYIAAAADTGINMILIPTHTPPLDTEIGTARPCVQLIDIEKCDTKYVFGFDKFRRFIDICKKNMDYVIIDSPRTGWMGDAEALAGYSDAVMLSAKQNFIYSEDINDALDSFCEFKLTFWRSGPQRDGPLYGSL